VRADIIPFVSQSLEKSRVISTAAKLIIYNKILLSFAIPMKYFRSTRILRVAQRLLKYGGFPQSTFILHQINPIHPRTKLTLPCNVVCVSQSASLLECYVARTSKHLQTFRRKSTTVLRNIDINQGLTRRDIQEALSVRLSAH
jgi:hypothetical protein